MLLVVLLLAVGIGLFAYGAVSSVSLSQQQDVKIRLAFVQVRDALIGWSVARTTTVPLPNARPGELPCPDMNNDGFEDGMCVAGAVGRVPWKTLGIPEPKDDAGETLWYAIGGPFRIWSLNGTVINSDTKGDLTVYQDSTATTITTEAVALIFAPGAPFGTQNRDPSTTALCPTTGTTIALNLCAANYLDATGGANNATTAGPYVSAQRSDTFNDRLLVITTAELMPMVEQRVARELRTALIAYRDNSGCGCYPWSYTSSCRCYPWADISDGTSNTGLNRGRVPTAALPEAWGSGTIPYLPGRDTGTAGWFVNNDWRKVIYYAIGKNFLEADAGNVKGGACTSCIDADLTFDGASGNQVVLIMPGPAGVSGAHATWPTDYFEDGENNDASNDWYVSPSSTAYARDRTYTIP
jgi:hypothetical protein